MEQGKRLTPENLKALPIGKYEISCKPYVTSPDFVRTSDLHVYERDGEIVFKIGNGILDAFMVIILEDEDESGGYKLEGICSIQGFSFCTYRHEFSQYIIKNIQNENKD